MGTRSETAMAGAIACRFFERLLRHTGEWSGVPFRLIPWQRRALEEIFGRVDDDGRRAVSLAYIEMPKKNGKTEFAAGLCLYMLATDPMPGCQVYGAAASQKQALLVFRAAAQMVEHSPLLREQLKVLRSTYRIVRRDAPDSFYAAIAADGDMSDGINPRCVVADELHRWRTRKQLENWEVLVRGGIARRNRPLVVAITTAGSRDQSPLAWRMHEKAVEQLSGGAYDPSFYALVYGAPNDSDWQNESTWIAANPSLTCHGGFLELERLREIYASSMSDSVSQAAFRRYHLNMWDQLEDRVVPMADWDACCGDWKAHSFEGLRTDHEFLARWVDRPCYVGIDIAMTTDLSAVAAVFPDHDGGYSVLPFYWLPGEAISEREAKDGVPYSVWVREGWLETCSGNVIDLRLIHDRLKWLGEMFAVEEFCFDRYNSREISVQMTAEGYPCCEVPQVYTHLSAPTKKLLALISQHKLRHGGHPVLRWNASCLSVKSDGNDLVRPVKPQRERERTRIDGISATINALYRAMASEPVDVRVTWA